MVISSPTSNMVNTKFVAKVLMLSLSMIVLQSTRAWSRQLEEKQVRTTTFLTETFEIEPGMGMKRDFWNVKFPSGHVGVKSFNLELVDEQGNSVPLYETYLHHYFVLRYFQNMSYLSQHPESANDAYHGKIGRRNDGLCRDYILPAYWSFGAESRGTSTKSPGPFAVEVGNPAELPKGHEERWWINVLVIDTRGAKDRKGCTECRCDLFNIPKSHLDTKKGIDGNILTTSYKGGLECCEGQCKLEEGYQGPKRKLAVKYTIEYVDWDQNQVPLKLYQLDVTDHVTLNGSENVHNCLVEFTIPENNGSNNSPYDIRRAKIPMKKGGSLIYGTAHVHAGIVNATLYGQDGRVLCAATPKYGTGKEPGNEKDYAVGMSVCYPKPGSVKIADDETLTVEFIYKSGFRTGVMGHFYINLAEKLT